MFSKWVYYTYEVIFHNCLYSHYNTYGFIGLQAMLLIIKLTINKIKTMKTYLRGWEHVQKTWVWLQEPMTNGLQPPVTIDPWDPPTYSGFHGQTHTLCIHSHIRTHIHMTKNKINIVQNVGLLNVQLI